MNSEVVRGVSPGSVASRARVAARVVNLLGGRFSTELGIDVDEGDEQVERWFLAATLFGTRISAKVATNTYHVLARAGVASLHDVARRSWDDLVVLLDAGGYTRYDFRTATRLITLAATVTQRYPQGIGQLCSVVDPIRLETELDRLPGWGPVTIRLFLRELRGVWPGAKPPLDERAVWAAEHLRLSTTHAPIVAAQLGVLATDADLDVRDLESALVRAALRHRRETTCAGGPSCQLLNP